MAVAVPTPALVLNPLFAAPSAVLILKFSERRGLLLGDDNWHDVGVLEIHGRFERSGVTCEKRHRTPALLPCFRLRKIAINGCVEKVVTYAAGNGAVVKEVSYGSRPLDRFVIRVPYRQRVTVTYAPTAAPAAAVPFAKVARTKDYVQWGVICASVATAGAVSGVSLITAPCGGCVACGVVLGSISGFGLGGSLIKDFFRGPDRWRPNAQIY